MVVDHRFLEKYGARSAPSVEKMAAAAEGMTRRPDREGRIHEAKAKVRRNVRLARALVTLIGALIVVGSVIFTRGFWNDLFGSDPAPAPAPVQTP